MSEQTDVSEPNDPQFDPIVSLPEKVVPTLEEDEEILFKMRAKLFRWSKESDPPEWKERGTGDIKLLKHATTSRIRILMRRDKTYKICANHYLEKYMELLPNCNSDRAWVWNTFADFSEEEAKEELLAIRFLNAENANKFKEKFEECQEMLPVHENGDFNGAHDDDESDEETDQVTEKLEELAVKGKEDDVAQSEETTSQAKTEEVAQTTTDK